MPERLEPLERPGGRKPSTRRNLERLSSGRAPMGKFINAPEGCRHGTHTSKHARTAPSVRPSVPLSVAVRQTDRRQPEGRVSSRAGLPMTTLGSPCDECNKRHYCLLKGLRAISKTKRVYE